ncbi:MAG: twin-arginine translocation signal domain-containing protein [Ilumatobacteraceae bacterium]
MDIDDNTGHDIDPDGFTRRSFLRRAAVGGAAVAVGGVLLSGGHTASAKLHTPVHGVCWDGDKPCKVQYVDLGPVDSDGGKPVYVFEADGFNPFDPGRHYSPRRLQNNVFGGGGHIWPMYLVHSAALQLVASTDGSITLHSTNRAPDGSPMRDLTTKPFRFEDELLEAADRGLVTITFTGVSVDCPIIDADRGDIVVDLNPGVGRFC